MTEHTDKSAPKSGRTAPRKRAGKAPAPESKRATAPHGRAGAGEPGAKPAEAAPPATPGGDAPRGPLAPDPATVVFGSNRPIAAQAPKLPESSGLRFSGSSAGLLKATGPQPASPKAAGLTFTTGKAAPAKTAAPLKPAAAKNAEVKNAEVKKAEAKKPEAKRPEVSKSETSKAEAEKPALTKPAIAPQASGRHFDKERSTSGFVLTILALTVLGAGLAFWMRLASEPGAPQQAAAEQTVPIVANEPASSTVEPVTGTATPPAAQDALTSAEIGEIQDLLRRLDLDPGSPHGILTDATTAAIRSYQEMAGLPADGQADRALLEELRSVAELYGA